MDRSKSDELRRYNLNAVVTRSVLSFVEDLVIRIKTTCLRHVILKNILIVVYYLGLLRGSYHV